MIELPLSVELEVEDDEIDMSIDEDSDYEMEIDAQIGSIVSGSQTFTENGTFDVSALAEAIISVPQGLSNCVTGTFTVDRFATTQEIEIPYEGNGYPIFCALWVDGGIGTPTQANFIRAQRYSIALFAMAKTETQNAPDYSGTGTNNNTSCFCCYKNSATALSYVGTGIASQLSFSTEDPTYSSWYQTVKFKTNNLLNIYVGGSNYTFPKAIAPTYRYYVVYSE